MFINPSPLFSDIYLPIFPIINNTGEQPSDESLCFDLWVGS